jgi:hypothetical protein
VSKRLIVVWAVIGIVGISVAAIVIFRAHYWKPRPLTIRGAVLRYDSDVRKQTPIADVSVIASRGDKRSSTQSGASGFFKISFPEIVWPGQVVTLTFRYPGYEPLDMPIQVHLRSTAKQLYVVELTPIAEQTTEDSSHPAAVVSNIRVRYTVNSRKEENIGSAVKTFVVANKGNVPCQSQMLCSPDGNWKASTGSVTLDAGVGNEFRNARVSCIAGPCPFTKIVGSGFERAGRFITASVVDWSDTATFLLEAEVFRTTIASNVRESYPVVFGRTLHFTLPPTQEGVSIEAELNGTPMVFPLGPELYLSWAICTSRTNTDRDKSTVYQCELKPGYRF